MALTPYDYAVLRHLDGQETPEIQSGAALWQTIEFLRNRGYVKGYEEITLTALGHHTIHPPCLP